MPALNTKLKLPTAALLYSALGALGVAIIITVGGVLLMFAAEASCSGPGCGILSSEVVLPFLLIIVLVVLAYPLLFWLLFSYELTGRTITVNSGILFRQYETMDCGRIQVGDNERGPLLWLLALTEVRIWTASASERTRCVRIRIPMLLYSFGKTTLKRSKILLCSRSQTRRICSGLRVYRRNVPRTRQTLP